MIFAASLFEGAEAEAANERNFGSAMTTPQSSHVIAPSVATERGALHLKKWSQIRHPLHSSNVASAAEVTKSGRFIGGNKATAADWLMQ